MNEELKEINERLDKIEKEIEDIKANYLTPEKLTEQLEKSLKDTKDCYW